MISSTNAREEAREGGGTHRPRLPLMLHLALITQAPTQSDDFIASMLGANGGGPGRSASSWATPERI